MSTLKTNRIENLTTTDGGISINNSGNVGIGATPAQRLHVASGASTYVQVQNTGHSVNAYYGVDTGGAWVGASTNHPLKLHTNNTEQFRVDSAGRIAIGSSSVNSSRKVEITQPSGYAAGLRIMQGGSGAYNQFFSGVSNWRVGSPQMTNALTFDEGSTSTERFRINSEGYITVSGPTNYSNIQFKANGTVKGYVGPAGFIGGSDTDMGMRAESGGAIVFYNGSAEKARLNSGGNFLVGTSTADGFKFKVTNGAGTLARFTDGTSQTLDIRQASGGIELQNPNNGFIAFKGSSAERARIQSSGGMSIGTTSSPTCLTQASALRLGNNTLGSHAFTNISTTVTNITAASGLGGLAFVQAYNTANGAQYVGLLMWRYGHVVSISENNNTGLTLNFSVSTNTLRLATSSGTVSGSVITLQAST